ncbi:hypothetical protein [Streptomyces doebereineriae]|uniref:Uncharacterized protein n=1 Tax=Streptomyces doebereineriae TaxID=3075528 RepID=A0ABU2VH35_9ACTN|nr:hypothetical protein [Streptomyces sp. DSM 41640]MDT0484901.1 hypothetical protein [Streptomyces sp. DSM 41640]
MDPVDYSWMVVCRESGLRVDEINDTDQAQPGAVSATGAELDIDEYDLAGPRTSGEHMTSYPPGT